MQGMKLMTLELFQPQSNLQIMNQLESMTQQTVGNNVNTQTEAHTNNSEVQVTTTTATVPKKRKRKKRLIIYIVT